MTDAARTKAEEVVATFLVPRTQEEALVHGRGYVVAIATALDAFAATQTADQDAEIARLTALVVQARDDAKAARADADTFLEALATARAQKEIANVDAREGWQDAARQNNALGRETTRREQAEAQTAALRAQIEKDIEGSITTLEACAKMFLHGPGALKEDIEFSIRKLRALLADSGQAGEEWRALNECYTYITRQSRTKDTIPILLAVEKARQR